MPNYGPMGYHNTYQDDSGTRDQSMTNRTYKRRPATLGNEMDIRYVVVDETYNQVISRDANSNLFTLDEAIEFARNWADGLKAEYRDNVYVAALNKVYPDKLLPSNNRVDTRPYRGSTGSPWTRDPNNIYNVRTEFNP